MVPVTTHSYPLDFQAFLSCAGHRLLYVQVPLTLPLDRLNVCVAEQLLCEWRLMYPGSLCVCVWGPKRGHQVYCLSLTLHWYDAYLRHARAVGLTDHMYLKDLFSAYVADVFRLGGRGDTSETAFSLYKMISSVFFCLYGFGEVFFFLSTKLWSQKDPNRKWSGPWLQLTRLQTFQHQHHVSTDFVQAWNDRDVHEESAQALPYHWLDDCLTLYFGI